MIRSMPKRTWSYLREQAPFLIGFAALVTTAFGLAGLLRWSANGDWSMLRAYFDYPNKNLSLIFAAAAAGLSWTARNHFNPRDTLRRAWTWLTAAAVAHLIGRILGLAPEGTLHKAAEIAAGPAQMLLLLIGLIQVAIHCRRLGIFRGLTHFDYALVFAIAAITIRTLVGIFSYIHSGKPITWDRVLAWPSDPLLMLLLLAGVFIRRSTTNMGAGLIAHCWRAFVMGIVLTALGDASLWCLDCSVRPVWMMPGWYLWLIADASFALAPAFQVAALERSQIRSGLLGAFAAIPSQITRAQRSLERAAGLS
jgi:hypothetical protein